MPKSGTNQSIVGAAPVFRPPNRSAAEVRLDTSLELVLEHGDVRDTPSVLATVVDTAGSTYRKSGARMLIMADGYYVGLLTGGCLETDLHIHAQRVLDSGMPRLIEYDMRGPDDMIFGIGAGCEGALRVLLEPSGPGSLSATALAAAGRITQAGLSTSLVTVYESTDVPLGTYSIAPALPRALQSYAEHSINATLSRTVKIESGQRGRAFIQYLAPPPHLLICGAGPDAQSVASLARALYWRVTVVDHRPTYAIAIRFPGCKVLLTAAHQLRSVVNLKDCHAAVVMSHHFPSDSTYLTELAEAGTPAFVGLLGPASRRRRLAESLGTTVEKLAFRLHGPVGLDIGAVTPEGIALAIVSQIHGWLAGRPISV
jgi:xanthine/CO dehydrogenase XdhC/CoxF family maturation factor